MALDKPLADLAESDFQSLITDRVLERKTLDYKAVTPGNSEGDRKEFLRDVSSFANASGGYLIYGMSEEGGRPTALPGLALNDPEREILRLEQYVHAHIKPRLRVETQPILLANGRYVLVMRIPQSFAQPHMMAYNWTESPRFLSRSSVGRVPLDIDELRAAFLRSETFGERARDFRRERISKVITEEAPLPLLRGGKVLFHLVPFTAFDPGIRYNVMQLGNVTAEPFKWLRPLNSGGTSSRPNFDGFLTYSPESNGEAGGYVQVFRNGIIEAVDASMLHVRQDNRKVIPSLTFEAALVQAFPWYVSVLTALGVNPPVFVMLTLVGVQGWQMAVDLAHSFREPTLIDRDVLDVPEIILEDFAVTTQAAPATLKDLFDPVWNAAGYHGSRNYDAQGTWRGQV